jgi:hypothetical protein
VKASRWRLTTLAGHTVEAEGAPSAGARCMRLRDVRGLRKGLND